ncbi:MAG TPA: hypothetical protein VG365_13190 [Solirubrobacteraceae bacterium]|jgi:hypothetical protein|nr:hypothetical protein [Solirubrobacteraceae bacterium]
MIAVWLLAALLLPAVAAADGDPASDFLLAQNVFYPYSPPVSEPLQRALNNEVGSAARAGFPIKVAVIGSSADLGAVASLIGRPQAYAEFLEREINFRAEQPLLVVMSAGYGVQGLPHASLAAAATLAAPRRRSSNGLATAALAAVAKLASADGHPIKQLRPHPAATATPSPDAGLLALVAVATVAASATIVLVRRRMARRSPRRRGRGR